MAKSEHKKEDNNWKAQECIDLGRKHYKQAVEMEENEDPNQVKIDALWGSSTKDFFFALVLGHNEAPRCLAISFNQGTGVKEDKYMAALLYGVALELQDPKCSAVAEEMPSIPPSMKPAIVAIAKLIKETQAKIPPTGVDAGVLTNQLDMFEDGIALSSGRLISTFFVSEKTSKQSIEEFKAENPGWVYHDDAYYQHIMESYEDSGAAAAAGGAASSLEDAFAALHP